MGRYVVLKFLTLLLSISFIQAESRKLSDSEPLELEEPNYDSYNSYDEDKDYRPQFRNYMKMDYEDNNGDSKYIKYRDNDGFPYGSMTELRKRRLQNFRNSKWVKNLNKGSRMFQNKTDKAVNQGNNVRFGNQASKGKLKMKKRLTNKQLTVFRDEPLFVPEGFSASNVGVKRTSSSFSKSRDSPLRYRKIPKETSYEDNSGFHYNYEPKPSESRLRPIPIPMSFCPEDYDIDEYGRCFKIVYVVPDHETGSYFTQSETPKQYILRHLRAIMKKLSSTAVRSQKLPEPEMRSEFSVPFISVAEFFNILVSLTDNNIRQIEKLIEIEDKPYDTSGIELLPFEDHFL